MKKLLVVIILIASAATAVMAQSSSADKKALKKELKTYRKMKPAQIRQMKMNYEAKLANMNTVQMELAKSQSREDSLQRLYNANSSRMKMMEKEMASAKSSTSSSSMDAKGVVYRVQLGAFTKLDVKSKFKSEDGTVNAENADGMDKYTIGFFRNFADAENFKNEIRKMGIKDAFIVAYNDGVRVPVSSIKK